MVRVPAHPPSYWNTPSHLDVSLGKAPCGLTEVLGSFCGCGHICANRAKVRQYCVRVCFQVEALDEIVKMGTDSGEKALKITQMQAAIQKLTDEVTAIRRENDSLKRRMAEVERLVNSGSTEPKKGKRATPSTEADESDVRNGR